MTEHDDSRKKPRIGGKGFGFWLREAKPTANGVRTLLSHIPRTDNEMNTLAFAKSKSLMNGIHIDDLDIKQLNQMLSECESAREFIYNPDDFSPKLDGNVPVFATMAAGIYDMDNICPVLCEDDFDGWALILPACMPWEMTDEEKELDIDRLKSIMARWLRYLECEDVELKMLECITIP